MAFQAFRLHGGPTYYDANQTPWRADVLEAGLVFAFCIVAASFYAILPGIRGKERLFLFIRVTASLYIGAVIVLTNWSYSWETGSIHTRTKYKAGSGGDIEATIGLHIGLRGINITLKGEPEQQLNETIFYNEHFGWEWDQGRLGFGPNAGTFNRAFRAAQYRGVPLPVLWLAEYFTLDGEGVRWGRHYRQAGWFTQIILWLCFPLWLLTNVMFFVLIKYGARCLAVTGLCMVAANAVWSTWRNVNELRVPWEAGTLTLYFGGSYYVCLVTGILCVVAGVAIYILDLLQPNMATSFFGVDPLQDDEEDVIDEDDTNKPKEKVTRTDKVDAIELRTMDSTDGGAAMLRPPKPSPAASDFIPYENDEEEAEENDYELPPIATKRKSLLSGMTIKRFQRSRRLRAPEPLAEEEGPEAGVGDVRIDVS